MKHQLWKSVIASLLLVLASNVLSPVEACNKNNADRLGEFVLDEKNGGGGSEIHHHHHYNKDGQLLPGPPSFPTQALQVQTAPIVESANPGGYSGHSAGQQIIHLNTGDSEKGVAKHVIVLQPAPPPPPPPAEEDLLASFFPKRLHHLHPKHFLKTHIHKLRHNFRSLLGHGHGHGKHSAPPPPPPPPPPQIIYQPQPIKISQIPLAQVEAYKPAALIPGSKVKAYAYISPDGYQPAVVVKQQKPHEHHIHHHPESPPHPGPHPSPEGPPPPHSHPPHQGQQVVYTGGSPHSEPSPYPHHHQQPGPPPPHPHYHSQPAPHSAYSPHYGHSQSPPPPQPQPHYHTHSSPPYKPAYQPAYPSSGSGEYLGGNAYGPSGYNPSQSLYESSPHGHSGGESPYGHGSTSPYGSGGSHFPPGYGGSSIY